MCFKEEDSFNVLQFSPITEHIPSTDVACWGPAVTEELHFYWVSKGVTASLLCQNKDAPFHASERFYKNQERCSSKTLFTV